MGPLAGMKIIELAGIGPGPFCAMLLADLGATVLRIERPVPRKVGHGRPLKYNLIMRSRKSVKIDLKKPDGVELVMKLLERSDALIEGFRPGVTERMGLGPDDCFARNTKLVYGRMTGWGQDGPLAQTAGHDINYISLPGALHATGREGQPPTFAMNLVGDFGGGSLYLAIGILSAIYEAQRSGKGQVVDAAIVDGTASLMTGLYGQFQGGLSTHERGTNVNDSGAHFYNVYECADGEYVSVGPIEAQFYEEMLRLLDIDPASLPPQRDPQSWPRLKTLLAEKFKEKTRDEWAAIFDGTDACVAPVLTASEAPNHPHMKARGIFTDIDGITQPVAAPRFSRSKPDMPFAAEPPESIHPDGALREWFSADEIEKLLASGTYE